MESLRAESGELSVVSWQLETVTGRRGDLEKGRLGEGEMERLGEGETGRGEESCQLAVVSAALADSLFCSVSATSFLYICEIGVIRGLSFVLKIRLIRLIGQIRVTIQSIKLNPLSVP